jgi:hypothetical protein
MAIHCRRMHCGRWSKVAAAAADSVSADQAPVRGPHHVARERIFQVACAHDLEGIVAKPSNGRYHADGRSTNWIKIKNAGYTQMTGRHELFDRHPVTRAKRGPVLRVP